MVLFFGILFGYAAGYLLSRVVTIRARVLIYLAAVFLIFITMMGIALLHVKYGTRYNPNIKNPFLTLEQAYRIKVTFSERLGHSLGVTLAWFLLGYLALGASFVWYQLKKTQVHSFTSDKDVLPLDND